MVYTDRTAADATLQIKMPPRQTTPVPSLGAQASSVTQISSCSTTCSRHTGLHKSSVTATLSPECVPCKSASVHPGNLTSMPAARHDPSLSYMASRASQEPARHLLLLCAHQHGPARLRHRPRKPRGTWHVRVSNRCGHAVAFFGLSPCLGKFRQHVRGTSARAP